MLDGSSDPTTPFGDFDQERANTSVSGSVSVGVRYVHKQVDKAIEDQGVARRHLDQRLHHQPRLRHPLVLLGPLLVEPAPRQPWP